MFCDKSLRVGTRASTLLRWCSGSFPQLSCRAESRHLLLLNNERFFDFAQNDRSLGVSSLRNATACQGTRASILLAVAMLLPLPIGNAKAVPLKEARVTQVIQDVRLLESNASQSPASVNDTVHDGTAVRTGVQSRAELTFTDQTLTRLGANTIFSFGAGARAVSLDSGAFLLYVPKNSGGAKIRMGTVTAAITGTTIMAEYNPAGITRFTVLEGSARLYFDRLRASVPIHAGQTVTFDRNTTTLPHPVNVNLDRLLRTSPLITDFPSLPSAALIARAARDQHPPLAVSDARDHAKQAAKDAASDARDSVRSATTDGIKDNCKNSMPMGH